MQNTVAIVNYLVVYFGQKLFNYLIFGRILSRPISSVNANGWVPQAKKRPAKYKGLKGGNRLQAPEPRNAVCATVTQTQKKEGNHFRVQQIIPIIIIVLTQKKKAKKKKG
jgi:hypothetical protein